MAARNSVWSSLLAIRQKRGGEAPPVNSPKTRENRITAIGNDLYSADSRSFLNPFLRISRCARLFPSHAQRDLHPRSTKLPPLVINPAPHLRSLSLSLCLCLFLSPLRFPSPMKVAWKLLRALHVSAKRKLFCLANHTRSLLAPRIITCVNAYTHAFVHVACSAVPGNIDTRYSYLVSKRRTSNHAIRYFEKIDTL